MKKSVWISIGLIFFGIIGFILIGSKYKCSCIAIPGGLSFEGWCGVGYFFSLFFLAMVLVSIVSLVIILIKNRKKE